MPVIGFLRVTSQADSTDLMRAFRQGLNEAGFVDGQNVAIEYRFADGQGHRLPELATDLVRRHVAVAESTEFAPVQEAHGLYISLYDLFHD
jgi:hypothetical protein